MVKSTEEKNLENGAKTMKTQKSVSLPIKDIIAVMELVKRKEYPSFSSFIREAVREKFDRISEDSKRKYR